VQQKRQHPRWQAAGVTAIIGLGADPGISNMLCRAVAERLDRIERISLYWAAERVGPEVPVLVAPYAVSTVLGEYAHASQQFLDGALREMPALSGHQVLELPEPWGRTAFMFSQHSEPLTVPFSEDIAEKGIREFTWRLHLPEPDHEAWLGLIKAGFADFDDPLQLDGVALRPDRFLEALMKRNLERRGLQIPETATHEIHLAIGEGERDGKSVTINQAMIGSPDPLFEGYTDAGTSMGMSIGVQLLADGPRRPGVFGPEEYFGVEAFFAELRKRHFKLHSDIPVRRA
jgi:saccharopine dehydrogenase-like NADP-dependent oxidoreductase